MLTDSDKIKKIEAILRYVETDSPTQAMKEKKLD